MRLFIGPLLAASVFGAEPKVIPLYPGVAPGAESWNWEETAKDVDGPQGSVPLFQAVAADDSLSAGALRLHTSWSKAELPAELHIYSTGAHGFSNIRRNMPVDTRTDRLHDWLDQYGLLKKAGR